VNASRLYNPDVRKLASRPDWQIALIFTLALRVLYSIAAALFSLFLHPDPALIRSNALTGNLPASGTLYYAVLGVWERFDTLWYLRIAERGYDLPRAVIFYPLYPAAIRVASLVMPTVVAALLVSSVAAFFYFWGLLRLAEDLAENARVRMLFVLCVWPTSFVLFSGYAESLNLALIVWAVVLGRGERWVPATMCGILAGMARPSGVLVAIPLVIMALRSRQVRGFMVLLTPVGLLGYWEWLRLSGRLSVVEAYRVYQGSTLAPPWASIGEALRLIVSQHDGLLAIKLGLVIMVVVLSLQHEVRLEDKLFALAIVVQMLMYTGRPLLGAGRYLLPAYAAFLVLGKYAERVSTRQFGFYIASFGFLNLVWFWAFLNWSLVF
jgi:hypothetical protein